MLQGLARQIFEVIQLCTSTSEPASGVSAGSLQLPGNAIGVLESREVTELPTKRHREQATQGGRHLQDHRHDAAAATLRQYSTSATVKATVLGTGELLRTIMEYLGGGCGAVWGRKYELERMALVCRAWRDAAHSEVLWAPRAKELIPRLGQEDRRLTQYELKTGAAGSYRKYLVRSGQLTRERRLMANLYWQDLLRLQCEVWDEDDFCKLSAENLLVDSDGDEVDLHARGPGPSFSVKSRPRSAYSSRSDSTPPQTLPGFLTERELRIRVTAHDLETGRRLDLWPNRFFGWDIVNRKDDCFLFLSDSTQMSSFLCTSSASVNVRVGLRVEPVDGVNGDGDDQTLWRVRSAFNRFETSDRTSVGRLIWSMLQ